MSHLPTPTLVLDLPKDPRVRRTRQLLKDALIQLIKTTSYDNISLTDVSKTAGVARQTIYDHYENKDALFLEIIHDLIRLVYNDENIPKLVQHLKTGDALTGESLFFLAARHRPVFLIAVDRFYGGFTDIMEQVLVEVITKQAPAETRLAQDPVYRQAAAAYSAGGIIAVLKRYVTGLFRDPKEAEEFAAEVSRGVISALSLDLNQL